MLLAALAAPDTTTLIVTSAVVAALVSTIIGGAFTMWNDHLRRRHETQLRTGDREHDRRIQALADRRARRDHRGARIYDNLYTIVDAALAVLLQVLILRGAPQKYKDSARLGFKPSVATLDLLGSPKAMTGVDPGTTDASRGAVAESVPPRNQRPEATCLTRSAASRRASVRSVLASDESTDSVAIKTWPLTWARCRDSALTASTGILTARRIE